MQCGFFLGWLQPFQDRFRVQGLGYKELELVEAGAPHLPRSISFMQAKFAGAPGLSGVLVTCSITTCC